MSPVPERNVNVVTKITAAATTIALFAFAMPQPCAGKPADRCRAERIKQRRGGASACPSATQSRTIDSKGREQGRRRDAPSRHDAPDRIRDARGPAPRFRPRPPSRACSVRPVFAGQPAPAARHCRATPHRTPTPRDDLRGAGGGVLEAHHAQAFARRGVQRDVAGVVEPVERRVVEPRMATGFGTRPARPCRRCRVRKILSARTAPVRRFAHVKIEPHVAGLAAGEAGEALQVTSMHLRGSLSGWR